MSFLNEMKRKLPAFLDIILILRTGRVSSPVSMIQTFAFLHTAPPGNHFYVAVHVRYDEESEKEMLE